MQFSYNWLVSAALLISLFGCASNEIKSEKSVFKSVGEMIYTDGNRAPDSMSPPKDASTEKTVIDPVYLRTQADYHFTLAEAYSHEGDASRAIEELKLTLVYDPDSSTLHLKIATEYIKKGLVSEALDHAKESVRLDGQNKDARFLLGGLYSSLKLYEKAAEQYDEVVKRSPESVDAYLYMGALLAEQSKTDEAIATFLKVTKLKDNHASHLAYYYIGRIHLEQKKSEKAREAFEKALNIKPDFVESILALGTLYENQAKKDTARKLYETFQEQYGPNDRVAEPLARIYLENEDFDKAYAQYDLLAAKDSENLNARVKLALILIEKKDYQRAVRRLKEILAIAPDADKIRFYLAAVYEEIHDYTSAIDHFKKVALSSPFYEESVIHAAYLYKVDGALDKALALIKDGLSQRPDTPQFYALYASLLDDKKDYGTALKMLTGAVEKFPGNDQLAFFLGTIQDKTGDKNSTITTMRRVLDINKDHVQALNYLAFTYAELNEHLEEAHVLAKRATELKPEDAYIRDTLGWVLYKLGQKTAAIRELEKAYKMKATESVIAEHLGDVYYSSDMPQRARNMYETAIKNESDQINIRKIQAKIQALERAFPNNPRMPASAADSKIPSSKSEKK